MKPVWILLLFVQFPGCSPLVADLLVLHGEAAPVYGRVASRDDQSIVFSVYRAESDDFRKREFANADVRMLVRTIDPARLQQLTVARLSEYRDYAEELSAFHRDPVARRLAQRLVLICLYHADNSVTDQRLAASAARLLPGLADDESQRRKFDLLSEIYGRGSRPSESGVEQTTDEADVRTSLLPLIRLLRRERFDEADQQLQRLDDALIDTARRRWSLNINRQRLASALTKRQVDTELLLDLVQAEAQLIASDSDESPERQGASDSKFWLDDHATPSRPPYWIPALTEFSAEDLNKTSFRDGRWVTPHPSDDR